MVMGCVSLVRRLGSATAPKRTADGERAGELPSKRAGGDDGQSGEPLLLAERRPLLGRSGGGGLHMPSFCEKVVRLGETRPPRCKGVRGLVGRVLYVVSCATQGDFNASTFMGLE